MADKTVKLLITADGRQAEQTLSGLSGTLTKFGPLAGAALGALSLSKLSGDLLAVNTETQRLQASLRTLTGSSAGAEAVFADLSRFAAETPFQLTELVSAFAKLKSMGLDPSEEALRSYGNTASAMGKDLNMMVEAVADAATGEFERLKEFGVKAKSEGDRVSFTFQGVTTTIGKNAAEIEGYLRGIGNVQFAGAMTEQMKTLGGAISNLQDNYENLLRSMGEDGGIAQALVGGANLLIEGLQIANREMKELTSEVRTTAEWAAAMSVGDVSFWEWMTTGAEEARAKLEVLKDAQVAANGAWRKGVDFIGPLPSSGGAKTPQPVKNKVTATQMTSAQLEGAASMGNAMVDEWRIQQAKFTNDTIIGLEAEKHAEKLEIQIAAQQAAQKAQFENDDAMLAHMYQMRDEFVLIEKQKQATIMSTADVVANSMSIVNSLGQIAISNAKGDQRKQRQISKGLAVANTAAGATMAFRQYGWPYGLVAAAAIVAAGAAQINAIENSDRGGQATTIGSGSTTTQFSSGNFVGQPTPASQQPPQALTINIQGPVIGQDSWVEDFLVPSLRRVGNRNVQLNFT